MTYNSFQAKLATLEYDLDLFSKRSKISYDTISSWKEQNQIPHDVKVIVELLFEQYRSAEKKIVKNIIDTKIENLTNPNKMRN